MPFNYGGQTVCNTIFLVAPTARFSLKTSVCTTRQYSADKIENSVYNAQDLVRKS